MITTQETSQSVSITASTRSETQSTADAEWFARELGQRMSSTKDRVAASMEKLAAAFPGTTISTKSMASFGEVKEYYLNASDQSSITISPEILSQVADDESLFDKVKQMVSSLFTAGQEQNLVGTGGGETHRNVSIQESEIRYVEVQRTANGTQMSVSSLLLETQQIIADTLDKLLSAINQNTSTGTTSSSSSRNTGFQNLVTNTNNWRLESFLTTSTTSGTWTGSAGMNGMVTTSTSIEFIIQQWSASSSSTNASGSDLIAYIQMMGLSDPLVFDLGNEGINLRGVDDGVYFDIKGDGSPVRTAFIQGNNAFLYLDQNGNGVADDVNELFGDHGGYANGFENLRQYDDNGDGVIDEQDAIYHDLRLWRDLNGDGVNQADESLTLAQAGITSINLNYDNKQELDQHGNVIGERSTFQRADGTSGTVADVWLRNR